MKQKDLQDSAKRAALGKLSGLVGIVCNVSRKTCGFHVDYSRRLKQPVRCGKLHRDADRIQTGRETGR